MAGRQKKQTGGSSVSRETLPMTPDRVIYECVSTISDLIQRQLERFPCPTKRRTSPRTSTEEDSMVSDIPCEVKSSIRSLSEDIRALFQSVTSLVQCQDDVLDQETPNRVQNTTNSPDTYVDDLKQQLGTLQSRLREMEQSAEKSSREAGRGRMGKKWKGSPAGKRQGSRCQDKIKTDLLNQQVETELGQKVSSMYRAAQELGTTTGNIDSLSSLGKVLCELDGLLTYMEGGYANSEQETKEVVLSEKRAELGLNNRPDTSAENKGKELVTKSSLEANGNRREESSNREAALRDRCNDTRSETMKETKAKPHHRGKISDNNTGSQATETHQTSLGQEKAGCTAESPGNPTHTELDLGAGNWDTNFEAVNLDSKNPITAPTVSTTCQSSAHSRISNKDLTETASVKDTVDSNQDLPLGNKSKSDTETSFDQKMRPKEESSGCENSLALNRRSSVTDLQAYMHTAKPLALSPAQLDMMPVSTTSCPDISWSPTATVKQLSSCVTSSRFVQFEQPRHVKMATVLGLAWVYVAVMAIFNMTTDISYAPFMAYAETVNGYITHSFNAWYDSELWF
ncbi:uncharacterized protein LOC135469153 [Liolophura sinensis]|uniref:uncharacterized protein LOC135469153 n=1 Tax=Liolophura sinensis TaxID=3198878 RepID=UPI003158FD91